MNKLKELEKGLDSIENKVSIIRQKHFIEENLHLLETQEYIPIYKEVLRNNTFTAIIRFPDDNQRNKYLDRLVKVK